VEQSGMPRGKHKENLKKNGYKMEKTGKNESEACT